MFEIKQARANTENKAQKTLGLSRMIECVLGMKLDIKAIVGSCPREL